MGGVYQRNILVLAIGGLAIKVPEGLKEIQKELHSRYGWNFVTRSLKGHTSWLSYRSTTFEEWVDYAAGCLEYAMAKDENNVLIISHSTGALVALLAAAKLPRDKRRRVIGLISIAGAYRLRPFYQFGLWLIDVTPKPVRGIWNLLSFPVPGGPGTKGAQVIGEAVFPAPMMSGEPRCFGLLKPLTAVGLLHAQRALRKLLTGKGAIEFPLLLIQPNDDELVDPVSAYQVFGYDPEQVTLIMVDGPHSVHLDIRENFWESTVPQEIAAWLEKIGYPPPVRDHSSSNEQLSL